MTAIQTSDIIFRLSEPTSPGNANAQGTLTASYGGYLATTAPSSTTNLLFPGTTTINETTYRCVFVENNTASGNTYTGGGVYLIGGYHSAGGTVSIGVDPTAASPIGSATAQAVTSATSGTVAPSGVTFSSPTTASTALALGDIPPGYCKAIWIRRTTPGTLPSPQFTETINLGISGSSAA